MGIKDGLTIVFFLTSLFLIQVAANGYNPIHIIRRSNFPKNFGFGASSSAYQYEGGVSTKGKSIWDNYTHQHPDRIVDHSNGDIALDTYHRYKEDISLINRVGFNVYRFSIAWSRILPNGSLKGGVNKDGVTYYNNLINELVAKGIQPYVTLFHWDVPQALEDEYQGFLSRRIVDDFVDYVEVCFKEFGDRVKHWISLNEPNVFSINGYATGRFAPARCSEWVLNNCLAGNSSIEPYIVAHHQILAHAHVVQVYRTKYQAIQNGVIGITVLGNWYEPYSDTEADKEAANRATEFFSGWFFNPIVHGDYPKSMRIGVKERLPKFTEEETILIKGSFDFLGLNYYTARYAIDDSSTHVLYPSYLTDSGVNTSIPIGPKVNASSWLSVYPQGLKYLLVNTKREYNNPFIYITENGYFDYDDPNTEKLINDTNRIKFYKAHLYYLHQAMKVGVKVRGFFAWSLLDNFEWADGYTMRFGLIYIDYKNNLTRIPKKSLIWFANFLKN